MGPYMPALIVIAVRNVIAFCTREMGTRTTFAKNVHTGFPSILRSGLRCDYTQAIYKTVRRALAGTVRKAQARSLRRAHMEFERRA
jgi:hypothetical protein